MRTIGILLVLVGLVVFVNLHERDLSRHNAELYTHHVELQRRVGENGGLVAGCISATVVVHAPDGFGSGVFIGPNIVLTARHVAELGPTHVRMIDKSENRVLSVHMDSDHDMALLVVERASPYLNIEWLHPDTGERIYAIGSPGSVDNHPIIIAGVLSSPIVDIDPKKDVRWLDMHVYPGNSGGPVIYNGRVIGIALAYVTWMPSYGIMCPMSCLDDDLRAMLP